jgi:PAS domain S-box-containing protein
MMEGFHKKIHALPEDARSPPALSYVAILLVVAAVFVAATYIKSTREDIWFFLFLIAVFQASFLFGAYPGLWASTLSVIALECLMLVSPARYEWQSVMLLSFVFCIASTVIISATAYCRNLTGASAKNQQNLRFAHTADRIGCWRLSLRENELLCSEQIYLILGIPAGAPLTYRSFLTFVHPEDRKDVKRKWQVGLQRKAFYIEHRLVVADKVKWIRGKAEAELDSAGSPHTWFGAVQDITESRQTRTPLSPRGKKSFVHLLCIDEPGIKYRSCRSREAGFMGDCESMIVDMFLPIDLWKARFPSDALLGMHIFPAHFLPTMQLSSYSGTNAQQDEHNHAADLSNARPRYRCQPDEPSPEVKEDADPLSLSVINGDIPQALAMLVDCSKDFIGLCDISYIPFYINPAGLRMVGLDSLQRAGSNGVLEFFFPDDRDFIANQIFPRVLQEDNVETQIRLRHLKNGAALWVNYTMFRIKNRGGETTGLAIVCRDITARKMAEDAQRKIDQHIRTAVKASAAAFWDRDLATGNVYFSLEWKHQIGYSPDELPNRWEEWEKRLHPEDKERVLAATHDCLGGGRKNYELEYRLRHKNGSYRWIHTRGSLLYDSQEQPCRLLGMNLDITDFKNKMGLNERRHRIYQSYAHQIALQTAAALAHEINQPLMAVASYTDIALHLIEETDNPNPDQLVNILDKSSQQLTRAGQVIRQLMSMLQKDEIVTETIVLDTVIHGACEIIREEPCSACFNIELYLAPNLPSVKANAIQVEKVLVNLLRNGLEAMQAAGMDSGTITVTTGFAASSTSMAQITVHDSGKGLEADQLKSIFQPFFSTKSKGLGMGLAISKALIEAQNGKLWVEQNKDSGLSFHFTLPFAS